MELVKSFYAKPLIGTGLWMSFQAEKKKKMKLETEITFNRYSLQPNNDSFSQLPKLSWLNLMDVFQSCPSAFQLISQQGRNLDFGSHLLKKKSYSSRQYVSKKMTSNGIITTTKHTKQHRPVVTEALQCWQTLALVTCRALTSAKTHTSAECAPERILCKNNWRSESAVRLTRFLLRHGAGKLFVRFFTPLIFLDHQTLPSATLSAFQMETKWCHHPSPGACGFESPCSTCASLPCRQCVLLPYGTSTPESPSSLFLLFQPLFQCLFCFFVAFYDSVLKKVTRHKIILFLLPGAIFQRS